jgi:DNA-directed RNA polymerase subunit RPC12/RpoP
MDTGIDYTLKCDNCNRTWERSDGEFIKCPYCSSPRVKPLEPTNGDDTQPTLNDF